MGLLLHYWYFKKYKKEDIKVIIKGNIEGTQDKQFIDSVSKTRNNLSSIQENITSNMRATGEISGKKVIKTFTPKILMISPEYFENQQENNRRYFSVDDILIKCVEELNKDKPPEKYFSKDDIQELIIGEKNYPSKTFIPCITADAFDKWFIILRSPNASQNQ